jgi:hypothetical protein
MKEPKSSSNSKLWQNGLLIVFICVCASPLAALYWSMTFAEKHGCIVHEGFVNPCVVNGRDYGEQLYSAFVSGWFMFFTLPPGGLALLYLIVSTINSKTNFLNNRIR